MTDNKTKYVRMDGYGRWIKMQLSDMDTHDSHFDKSGGRFTLDFYPETEEELDKYWASGAPEVALGHQMLRTPDHPRYGNGDPDLGIGSYLKLRKDNNANDDRFAGPPNVFDWRGDKEGGTDLWDFEEDGLIWNGSKVAVKYSIWNNSEDKSRAVIRLQSLAVLELADEPEIDNTKPRF